ncbi:MAG: VWA domain-containing protein [Alphaproteobacteria bacterium]|nr:VWA domain-containing protein [Alphaproteobacteria bacterium]
MLILALLFTALASVVPLSDVTFDVVVSGPIADVEITQTFRNDSDETIEAVYLFPLHERAVVDKMVMRLDDRTIEGRIEEVEAAREQYRAAIEAGQTAALTESVRWNLFRQTVGNIPPGAQIEVSLRIIQPVPRNDAELELVLPLVAGARFVPPGVPEEEAMAAPYGGSPVRAHVHLAVDGGVELQGFRVTSHEAFTAPTGEGWEAHATDLPMTRDFVAKWRTRTNEPQIGALHDGEHLLLVFEPPEPTAVPVRRPREVFVVLDRSGSMSGAAWPLAQQAVFRILDSLQPDEVFDLFTFAAQLEHHGRRPAEYNQIAWGKQIVAQTSARGTTDLRGALQKALTVPVDPERQRYVVLISDGLVANETGILEDLAAYRGDAKVFALGVGGAVNRFVLEEAASQGGGVAVHLRGDDGTAPAEKLIAAMDRPTLSGIQVDWGDWGPMDMAPARIPDVHLGRPIQVLVRTQYEEGGPIIITGKYADDPEPIEIRVLPRRVARGRAIASTWARQRIEALGREQIRTGRPAIEEGLPLALEYSILSPWTAFVAIDPRVRQVQTRSIDVPLGQPGDRPALFPDTTTAPAPVVITKNEIQLYEREPDFLDSAVDDRKMRAAQKVPAGRSYESTVEVASGQADVEAVYRLDGVAITDPTTGTFSVNFNFDTSPERRRVGVPVPVPLSLTQGWGKLAARGGSTVDDLRQGEARLAFSAPLAHDRFAVAADTGLELRGVDGGSWRQIPVGVRTSTGIGYRSTRLDLAAAGRFLTLEGPTIDTFDAQREALGGSFALHGRRGWLVGDLGRATFACGVCDGSRRTVGTVSTGLVYGESWAGGTAGLRFARTGFEGTDALQTADVGLDLAYRRTEGAWILAEASGETLWADGFRFLPSGRAELGYAPGDAHFAIGGGRSVDTRVPELSLPVLTEAYAVAFFGSPEADTDAPTLRVQSGWQHVRGPLALPIARLQELPEGEWSRQAVVSSAALRFPSGYRGQLDLLVRHTLVLRSDADLDAPTAPWTPGLVLAHRPLYVAMDGRWRPIDRRWQTDLELEGGLATPLGGERWWSGWQVLGELGVVERIPVRSDTLAIGVHGMLREGRPGDVDPTRVDGWFAPERLGNVGIYGSIAVEL